MERRAKIGRTFFAKILPPESTLLPAETIEASPGSYFSAVIYARHSPLKPVSIYLRKTAQAFEVVGLDRAW